MIKIDFWVSPQAAKLSSSLTLSRGCVEHQRSAQDERFLSIVYSDMKSAIVERSI